VSAKREKYANSSAIVLRDGENICALFKSIFEILTSTHDSEKNADDDAKCRTLLDERSIFSTGSEERGCRLRPGKSLIFIDA